MRHLLDIAEKIEGLLRNASTHAAGIVIGDRPLVELVPLYRDPRSDLPVTNAVLSSAIAQGHISARVMREGPLFRPPPRTVESSIDKFNSASFEVITTYDRTDEQLGRQQITEGVLVLVPKF